MFYYGRQAHIAAHAIDHRGGSFFATILSLLSLYLSMFLFHDKSHQYTALTHQNAFVIQSCFLLSAACLSLFLQCCMHCTNYAERDIHNLPRKKAPLETTALTKTTVDRVPSMGPFHTTASRIRTSPSSHGESLKRCFDARRFAGKKPDGIRPTYAHVRAQELKI